jgi:hypothetical protein
LSRNVGLKWLRNSPEERKPDITHSFRHVRPSVRMQHGGSLWKDIDKILYLGLSWKRDVKI